MASSLPADPCVALPTGSAAALRWLLAALRAEPDALANRGIEAQVEATGDPRPRGASRSATGRRVSARFVRRT